MVNRGNSDYQTLLTSTEMATELALVETIDAAKELAADRMDMAEILTKIDSLVQVFDICVHFIYIFTLNISIIKL